MPTPNPARRQLGEFLRARRDQLRPADFGLPDGQRRRAPGLRREEAALLCGISPTWLAWIEQGRTTAISVSSLVAIARGLRLSKTERRYLFELAARQDPHPPRSAPADAAELRPLLDALNSPAYVLDRHWHPLAWNRPAAALFREWLGGSPARARSGLLEYVFLHPGARRFIVNWPGRSRRLVAEFRADTAGAHDDPACQLLVAELSAASEEFRRAWSAQEVLAREGGERSFQPAAGARRTFQQLTFRPAQWPELKLVTLTARR
ncbi:MAG: helix-turn-helix transcriptional regulator [Steroidobacteraceae bacterium]